MPQNKYNVYMMDIVNMVNQVNKVNIAKTLKLVNIVSKSANCVGTRCLVGFETISRILRASNLRSFWINLPQFRLLWIAFGNFWTDSEHFLTLFLSRFLENGSDAQKA